MKRWRPAWIYTAGLVPLGLSYQPMKQQLGEPLFFFSVIAWLLLIRFLAVRYGRRGA